MINPQKDIASFTMRFVQQRWKDTDGEPQLQWKGYIRHIQSDDEITFVDFSHAVQFIQEHLVALTANATSDSSESDQQAYLSESFKLWNSFLANYSNMVFSTMQSAMKQTGVIQTQVEEATRQTMNRISFPLDPSQYEVLKKINKLQADLDKLQAEVNSIENRLEEIST